MSGATLAIRPRALGDVVLVTPALRALARGCGDSDLEVVTEVRYAPLLEGLPGVKRIWPLPRTTRGTLSLIAALRARGIARVVDFFGNPRTALIARWCGTRERFGYALRGRAGAYRVRVPRGLAIPGAEGGAPRREYAAATHLRLAEAAGGEADGLETRVSIAATARAAAEVLLRSAGVADPSRTVGLVAAGSWPTKTWPTGQAALLARRLMETGWRVLAILGPGEEGVAASLVRVAPRVAVLPDCGVAELAAVIARLGAVVGTDSGPRHLAAALGVPSFAWFGPTHPDNWNPPGEIHGYWQSTLPCRGCDRVACPHWNCLPRLSAAEAAEAVLRHLEAHAQRRAG